MEHIKGYLDEIQYLLQTFFHIQDDRICKVYLQYVIVHVPFQEKQKHINFKSK